MRVHINDKNEVNECRARKVQCKFQHFDSYEAAEQFIAGGSTVSPPLTKAKPIPSSIFNELSKFGLARGLNKNSSESEVITKAFSGNRESFKNFVQISARDHEGLKPEAMKSIGKFASKGISVDTTYDYHALPLEKDDEKFNTSEVDVLETPSNKDIINSLVGEFGKPF